MGEQYLKFGDVVTAKLRAREVQEALTELPTRLFESLPRRQINNAREGESARTLKGFNQRHGLGVKDVVTFVGGAQRERAQSRFEFAHTRARGAWAK